MNYVLVGRILFVIFCTSVIQVSNGEAGSNCLKTHPRVLHALFDYYNNYVDPWEVTEDEVRSMTHLFSSRFDRAIVENGILAKDLLPIAIGVAKYRAESKSGVQLYLSNHMDFSQFSKNGTIEMLKGYLNMIRTVHQIENGTIGGLILRTNMKTFAEDLEVYESVFGPLESFTEFKLGMLIQQTQMLKTTEPNELFPKLKFLTMTLEVKNEESPELCADEIISTCNYFQAVARSKNISAEILCTTGYPSKGTTRNGVEGSLDGFHRFWCRIAERLTSGKNHAHIIMRSAFDESSTVFDKMDFSENVEKVFYGWWRRNNYLSSYESDFDEKVQSLKSVSRSKLQDYCVLNCCSDSSYLVGVLVIVLVQFVLIVFLVLISIKNLFSTGNAKPNFEDTPTFEMTKPEFNILNDEELLLPSGLYRSILYSIFPHFDNFKSEISSMYLKTKYGIAKSLTIVLGIVATFLGYKSILTSWVFEYWNDELTSLCAETVKCPASWKTLERIFLGFSVLILIFSCISLGMGHCIKIFESQVVYWDSVLQFLAGVLLLISSELVLDTAIKLDTFFVNTVFSNVTDFDVEEFRSEMNYEGKVATGAIGIANGVLYIIAAGIIASKWKPPRLLVEINSLDGFDIEEIQKSESSSESSSISS